MKKILLTLSIAFITVACANLKPTPQVKKTYSFSLVEKFYQNSDQTLKTLGDKYQKEGFATKTGKFNNNSSSYVHIAKNDKQGDGVDISYNIHESQKNMIYVLIHNHGKKKLGGTQEHNFYVDMVTKDLISLGIIEDPNKIYKSEIVKLSRMFSKLTELQRESWVDENKNKIDKGKYVVFGFGVITEVKSEKKDFESKLRAEEAYRKQYGTIKGLNDKKLEAPKYFYSVDIELYSDHDKETSRSESGTVTLLFEKNKKDYVSALKIGDKLKFQGQLNHISYFRMLGTTSSTVIME